MVLILSNVSFFEHQRDLHDKARHDFMALLEETNKETMAITPTTTVADWPKIEQLIRVRPLPPRLPACPFSSFFIPRQGDKRFKAFDVRPEERLRLLVRPSPPHHHHHHHLALKMK